MYAYSVGGTRAVIDAVNFRPVAREPQDVRLLRARMQIAHITSLMKESDPSTARSDTQTSNSESGRDCQRHTRVVVRCGWIVWGCVYWVADHCEEDENEVENLTVQRVRALTKNLVDTYQKISPDFAYNRGCNPRRILTKPSGAYNPFCEVWCGG